MEEGLKPAHTRLKLNYLCSQAKDQAELIQH